ncbi:putative membrane protein [Bosea sp. BK604]|nr:putative membrane protein [Bosea sp. BK604]
MISSRRNSIEIIPAVGDAARLKTELLVLGASTPLTGSAKRIDELSEGGLSLALERGTLASNPGATLLIDPMSGVAAARLLLVGLDDGEAVSEDSYCQGLLATARALAELRIADAVVALAESKVHRRPVAWRVQQAGRILARPNQGAIPAGAEGRSARRIMLLIPQTLTLQLVEALRQGIAMAEGADPAPSGPCPFPPTAAPAYRPELHDDARSRSIHLPPATEDNLMSDLVFIAFPTEQKAEEVRQKVLSLQREYLIELGDAVVVVKDEKGHVKLNQMMNLTAAGAASGALWGTLIGFIFLAPLVGTALGAASGALGGKLTDVGINDKFMKEAASALQPNTAGLFLLIRKMTTDKVLADLKGAGGTLISTSFDETKEAALREALAAHASTEAAAAPAAS